MHTSKASASYGALICLKELIYHFGGGEACPPPGSSPDPLGYFFTSTVKVTHKIHGSQITVQLQPQVCIICAQIRPCIPATIPAEFMITKTRWQTQFLTNHTRSTLGLVHETKLCPGFRGRDAQTTPIAFIESHVKNNNKAQNTLAIHFTHSVTSLLSI